MSQAAAPVLEVLRTRGFVAQCSDESGLAARLAESPITAYCGYDATAPSLHVGHLVPIMLLAHLQRAGHRVIGIVGGGTTLIGDPTGKTAARPMLSPEAIDQNLARIRRQLSQHLRFDGEAGLMLNNAEWLLRLGYLDFLREIGRHFTVNQLMQHETYWERFQSSSLSFIELNYAMIQAYDFLHLNREYGCVLQTGGNDQWFNILAGVDLTRRAADTQVFALTTPLLTTTSGAKMGKTESGAVWLDADLRSPYDFYQFWRNTEDADVGRFLRLFTFLPLGEIARLDVLRGGELNAAKEVLAFEVTRLNHGEAEAGRAQETSRSRFYGEGADLGPAVQVAAATSLSDLLVASGLAASRSEAKRQVKGGGVRLGGVRQEVDREVSPAELPTLLSVGKRKFRLEVVA